MLRTFGLALSLMAAMLLLVIAGPGSAAPKKLAGTVGPGFTISLKLSGAPVTKRQGRPVPVGRQRPLVDPRLPSHGARREQGGDVSPVHRDEGRAPHAEEGRLHVRVRPARERHARDVSRRLSAGALAGTPAAHTHEPTAPRVSHDATRAAPSGASVTSAAQAAHRSHAGDGRRLCACRPTSSLDQTDNRFCSTCSPTPAGDSGSQTTRGFGSERRATTSSSTSRQPLCPPRRALCSHEPCARTELPLRDGERERWTSSAPATSSGSRSMKT